MAGYPLTQDSEDLRVLDSVQRGGALDELYRRYASVLKSFCQTRLGNQAEAEDACHEAILKLSRALPDSRPGPVWPWLATIARNVCTDIHRARHRETHLIEEFELADEPLEEVVERRLRSEIVLEALRRIPDNYGAMIRLRHYNAWSYEEIANFHQVTVASVKSSLYRARRILRQEIEKVARGRNHWPLPVIAPWGWWIRLTWDDLKISIGNARSRLYGEPELTKRSLELIANTTLATMLAIVGIVATSPSNENVSLTSPAKVSAGATEEVVHSDAIVRLAPPGQLPSEDARRRGAEIGTPSYAATVPVWDDEEKKDPRVEVPPILIDCNSDPEQRGLILNSTCPILEDLE